MCSPHNFLYDECLDTVMAPKRKRNMWKNSEVMQSAIDAVDTGTSIAEACQSARCSENDANRPN